MTAEAWDLLVRRLEAKAKSEPRGYRLRVALLAALGYSVLAGALFVAVAGLAFSLLLAAREPVAIKLIFLFGPLAWVIVRALPVKLPPPEGLELSRQEAPELFALVDGLRKQSSAPRIHLLLVDGELNASVAQIPRLGAFGPSRNYLVVGLPLLDALSPDEFRAVIAHELGHVSARHGRFSAWVYRLRQTGRESRPLSTSSSTGEQESSAVSSAGTRPTSARSRSCSPASTSTRPTRRPQRRPARKRLRQRSRGSRSRPTFSVSATGRASTQGPGSRRTRLPILLPSCRRRSARREPPQLLRTSRPRRSRGGPGPATRIHPCRTGCPRSESNRTPPCGRRRAHSRSRLRSASSSVSATTSLGDSTPSGRRASPTGEPKAIASGRPPRRGSPSSTGAPRWPAFHAIR